MIPASLAYAADVTIEPVSGSATPGCEDTEQSCFLPHMARANVGDTVIMTNADSAAHTFTSDSPSTDPDGVFDSGLLLAGSSFEWGAN